MHTAGTLRHPLFDIAIDGKPATREDLLAWRERDRLGVVVNAPFGGLGAGLLVSLAITAFYDLAERRRRPLYPDIYLFHSGGPWGDHSHFDFWPAYKEVFLPRDADAVLAAINAHGITHLAVPDGPGAANRLHWAEREAALDRIKRAFAYATDGDTANANVVIRSSADAVLENFILTLWPDRALGRAMGKAAKMQRGSPEAANINAFISRLEARLDEVPEAEPGRLEAVARLAAAVDGAGLSERLRRIDAADALDILG